MFSNLISAAGEMVEVSEQFDVTIFLYLAVILLSTKIFGMIFRKFGLPQVVGALLAGIIVGPFCLNLVSTGNVVNNKILGAIAQIGVLLIMFSAGLDTNLKEIKRNGIPSVIITTLGVVVPLGLGFLVGWGMGKGFAPLTSQHDTLECIFYGILLTATSVGITVEVLKELGKLKGKVGSSILSAAILDDIIGIVILSVAISLKGVGTEGGATGESVGVVKLIEMMVGGPIDPIAGTITGVLMFFVFAGVAGVLVHYAFKWLSGHFPVTRRLSIFGLFICFFFAWAAEAWFGVASITGAFLAGIVMSNMAGTNYVEKKIDTSAYLLFSPVFFANIGITMDFSKFNVELLGLTAVFVLVGLISKIIGCGAGALMCKYSFKDSMRVGFGMMARGEVVLIVAQKGIAGHIMDESIMFPVLMLIVISSFLTPIMLKLLYRKEDKSPLEFDGIEPPLYEEAQKQLN